MDFSSIRTRLSYPIYVSLLFSGFCFLHPFLEASRFSGTALTWFIVGKFIFGTIGFVIAYDYYLRGPSDLKAAALCILLNIYVIYFMWIGPLYETAYLQVAVGAAFIRLKRPAIFYITFSGGLIGMYLTYYFQDQMKWKLPPSDIIDWYFVVVVFFLLGWIIQNYAVKSFRNEEDRLSRLTLLGKEASTLIHDVEFLLSKSLSLTKDLGSNSNQDLAPLSESIQNDLKAAQTTLRSFKGKTGSPEALTLVNITELWDQTKHRLRGRLGSIAIDDPESKTIKSDPEILKSAFFNLLLNTLESGESKKNQVQTISLSWKGWDLMYTDGNKFNIDGFSGKGSEGGLGLQIIKDDLRRLGIECMIKQDSNKSVFVMKFKTKA